MSTALHDSGELPTPELTEPRRVTRKERIVGVDVARGGALIGMIATHVFSAFDDNGDPSVATVVASGRSATTFVVVAGVGLALLSGGRLPVRGDDRIAASAALAVRAVLVGGIGLALGYLGPANGIDGILPLYGLLFLLAIPLMGCTPRMLLGIAAALTLVGPVLIVATADLGLPYSGYADDPTFTRLVQDPGGLLFQLGLTGAYPAVIYLAYLCVGLAIGRLDLGSRRVAWWLLGGGLGLAAVAQVASAVALYRFGGLDRLVEQSGSEVTQILWEPELSSSWWYLALSAPHSHTPLDMLHTVGSALAVLGAALLLTRIPWIARASFPLAAAGGMSLTLYSAHLILLAFGAGEDEPLLLFVTLVAGLLVLAAVWKRWIGQGPLEAVVSEVARSTRRAVADHVTTAPEPVLSGLSVPERLVIRVLALVACAGVLAFALWGAAGSTPAAVEEPVVAAETQAPVPSTAPRAAPLPPLGSVPVLPVADVERFCALSDDLESLDEAQLTELQQTAPGEIRSAVDVLVADLREEETDEDALAEAESAVDDFSDRTCR